MASTVNMTRQTAVQLMRAGHAAATAGRPVTAIPHKVTSKDAAERVKAQAWLRGYVQGNRRAKANTLRAVKGGKA